MGLLIYQLGVEIYWLSARILSVFNLKAKQFVLGRKGWRSLPWQKGQSKVVWFHTASLGEFEQGRPVMEQLKGNNPTCKILVTFFSPSGFEVRQSYKGADLVMYLPKDSKANAKTFFDKFQPDLVCFVKYEYWYHFLKEGDKRHIPIVQISGIFRTEQVFFKWYGAFYRQILRFFEKLFIQNQESEKLLKSIGVNNSEVAGDTRFDRVIEVKNQKREIAHISEFKQNASLIVVGSLWDEDMKVLANLINDKNNEIKFVLAPHKIDYSFISRISDKILVPYLRYSEANSYPVKDYSVLIIDNIGLLSSLYSYADYAYIGGAFGEGLHNTLEAAVFGIPVFFGNKNYKKFQEAVDLADLGGAFPVGSSSEMNKALAQFTSDEAERKRVGKICSNYVEKMSGATSVVSSYLEQKLAE